MSANFTTTTYGKWILAGEHSVIRGYPALVFPVTSKSLTLTHVETHKPCKASFEGEAGHDMHLLFFSLLEHAAVLLNHSINDLTGQFHLNNTIPMGAGLGASAALSVALTRFFIAYGWMDEMQSFVFAKRLEDFFHGKSSGVDIAGVSAKTGVYFQQGHVMPISMAWQPCWVLSSCGQRGFTADCVNKVQDLWERDSDKALMIDEKMATAVQTAKQALEDVNRPLMLLKDAINSASECFEQWGLISESLAHHLSQLKSLGAIAAKPTGSGKGGYVISLWESLPDDRSLTYIQA